MNTLEALKLRGLVTAREKGHFQLSQYNLSATKKGVHILGCLSQDIHLDLFLHLHPSVLSKIRVCLLA